jgi:hypothetical protein
MDRLHTQHHRLFMPPGALAGASHLLGADGHVRALVLGLASPADWSALAPLWRGVQVDLKWPEPAIVVNGRGAFELWFSLAEPLPAGEAARLLAQLQHRYLGGVRAERLQAWPGADAEAAAPACPPFATGPDRWAAFVTPDLPAVFGDDPALDFEPGADAQAELLARLRPVNPMELRTARAVLAPAEPSGAAPPASAAAGPGAPVANATIAGGQDPRAFLLAVMNDPDVPLALRIEAAKGLLQAPGGGGC